MLNTVEFKQASMKAFPGTDEVFVLNQSSPVYAKNDAFLTGDDIISAEFNDDNLVENRIAIKLTLKGMELVNKAAEDKDFPMVVFFVNGKSIQVIHRVSLINEPEMTLVMSDDRDFAISLAELIKSGVAE